MRSTLHGLAVSAVLAVALAEAVPAHAAAFENIPPLSFTMRVGGANPLPQVLSVLGAGTNFDFGVTVSTSSGGSWLSVAGGPNCCSTPWAITVNVTNVSKLAAGTYTGQLAFKQFPTGAMMTVPVTLFVELAGTHFLGALPGQLSFSMKTSGNAPPRQFFQIRSGGGGPLSWALTVSTGDGGAWLQPSVVSGTTPSRITVSIQPSSLPGGGTTPGTFAGQLLFQAGADSVTVPVSVIVGDSVFVQVNPISFTMPVGGANPLPQVLAVANTGTKNFDFSPVVSTSSGGNWLSFGAGKNCCVTPWAITVNVTNVSKLAVGTYMGQITFNQFPYARSAITVPVTLIIEPASAQFFAALPGELSFSMKTAGLSPPSQSIQVFDGGSSSLNWTMSVVTSDGSAWLKTTSASGTTPKSMSVSVVTSLLPGGGATAGTFVGQLLFQSGTDSITVPVSVTVGASVFVQANPINFVMPAGGANPLPQVLSVASTGTPNFDFGPVVSTGSGGNWLSIATGPNCCVTSWAVTLIVANTRTLPAGTYLGQVAFNKFPYANFAMVVPVTLTIVAPGGAFFDNEPGQTSFSFVPGGKSVDQIVPIYNGGSGTLNWTIAKTTSDGAAWLSVSPVMGAAPSTVAVHVFSSRLPGGGTSSGTFVGQQLLKTATGNVTVPVSVTVGASVFVPLQALTFTAKAGTNPASQNITVASTGTNFDFVWLASTGAGGNWLNVTGGVNCCRTPWSVTVSVNSSALAAGNYVGQMIFTPYPYAVMAMTVPVILTVTP